jgi:hypothetical protein
MLMMILHFLCLQTPNIGRMLGIKTFVLQIYFTVEATKCDHFGTGKN